MQSFSKEQSSLLLALRTRTVRGIRSDFGEIFMDKHSNNGFRAKIPKKRIFFLTLLGIHMSYRKFKLTGGGLITRLG